MSPFLEMVDVDPIRRSSRDALARYALEAFLAAPNSRSVVVCRRGEARHFRNAFQDRILPTIVFPRRPDFVIFHCTDDDERDDLPMTIIRLSPKFAKYDGLAVWTSAQWLGDAHVERAASLLLVA